MGKLVLNGRNYSGLIDAQGIFIDTDNIIYSAFVFDDTEHTWTATADCVLTGNMYPPDSTTAYYIKINGAQVFAGYASVENPFVYVMKGQTVSYRAKSTSMMKAYGIQMGSQVTFLSEYASACYSTTEREVGCWVDGKPLYQKTFIWNETFNSDTIKSISLDNPDYVFIVDASGINSGGSYCPIPYAHTNIQNVLGVFVASTKDSVGFRLTSNNPFVKICVTIRYTKTTDVAGSGSWTPTATPTHHYSTDEQVVGTWLGQTLYQKSVSLAEADFTKSNNWHWSYNYENLITGYDEVVDLKATMKLQWASNGTDYYNHIVTLGGDCYALNNSDSPYLKFANYYRHIALKGYPYNNSNSTLAKVKITWCNLTIQYTKSS